MKIIKIIVLLTLASLFISSAKAQPFTYSGYVYGANDVAPRETVPTAPSADTPVRGVDTRV